MNAIITTTNKTATTDETVNKHASELGHDLLSLLLIPQTHTHTPTQTPWQVHNCKVTERICHQHGTLPFLYHYDRLDDEQKQRYPLTPALLSQFNQPMTADDAKQLLANTYGIHDDISDINSNDMNSGDISHMFNIVNPWFVRVAGSAVLYQPELLLALRLHWQSSTQPLQPIYCQEQDTALRLAIDGWSLYGRVDVLYQGNLPLSLNMTSGDGDTLSHLIPKSGAYQLLPTHYAIRLLTELNENLNALFMLDNAIKTNVL